MRKEPTSEPHMRLRFSEYAFLTQIGSNAVLLYMALLKWQYSGYCSKSLNFLAKESGLCKKTVHELIKKFLHLKILKKLPTINGEKNEYELLDFATQEQTDEQPEKAIHTGKSKQQPTNRKSDADVAAAAAAAAAKRRTERASAISDNFQDNQKIPQDSRIARTGNRRAS